MATVFMRWLERRPAAYERGIQMLTLGRLESLHQIVANRIQAGQRVLEIGCGSGALTLKLASRAAHVDAIDVSADMLAEAQARLISGEITTKTQFTRMDAQVLETVFAAQSFDVIVASLFFSELPVLAQQHVMRQCRNLLKPGGEMLILDEIRPANTSARVLGSLIRVPLKLLTWLLTRTTTHPLQNPEDQLHRSGWKASQIHQALGGTLILLRAGLRDDYRTEAPLFDIPRLGHAPSLASRMRDLWALFFRVLPPYPSFEPGLYAVGDPDHASPVLVTGNYDLTVRRVVAEIDTKADVWLLVADSAGVNVWCGAGAGFLTAERIAGALQASGIGEWHTTRMLVLPQLCANGVDGAVLREQSGWKVRWGPVRAHDIPEYLQRDMQKTDAMRTIRFPLLDRLEMVSATLGLYALIILLPVALFWRSHFLSVLAALLGLSYFYALVMPWIPGRDGLAKSVPLGLIALLGMLAYSLLSGPVDAYQLFRRAVGMLALSVFVAAELQGMSPEMRGEQANWGWEALIAAVLGGAYWLVPRFFGWGA